MLEGRRSERSPSGRVINLTLPELVCIENTLSPSQVVQEVGPDKNMMLRVGDALREAYKTQADQVVYFGDADLWLLRERLSIYASQGSNVSLGLVLKCKVYEALLGIAADDAVASLGMEVLRDDRTYADEDTDTNEVTGDDAGAEAEA